MGYKMNNYINMKSVFVRYLRSQLQWGGSWGYDHLSDLNKTLAGHKIGNTKWPAHTDT